MSSDEAILSYIHDLSIIVMANITGQIHQGHIDGLTKLMGELSSGIQKEKEMEKSAETFGFDILFPRSIK